MKNKKYIHLENISKTYKDGFRALENINLSIKEGEIFALLGPNGAGKTTLINIVCGLVYSSSGQITVNNINFNKNTKKVKSLIGLVPQELSLEAFETVFNNVSYTRGLYGKKKNKVLIEKILKKLSLWGKKDTILNNLSGGMKRRVLIAKSLSHEPKILFLDEPSAGVDVELRREMWKVIKELKKSGVTIILTTHYIEEAEAIADRIGVINNGKIILVEDKNKLMQRMGQKKLVIDLHDSIRSIPSELSKYNLKLSKNKKQLIFAYDKGSNDTKITSLLNSMQKINIILKDINTRQSSLENIFVNLLKGTKA